MTIGKQVILFWFCWHCATVDLILVSVALPGAIVVRLHTQLLDAGGRI